MKILKFLLSALAAITICSVIFVYAAPEKATSLAINAERSKSGLERKEIDLPGGIHYVYLEGGKGEPLMLFHGFGANKDNFVRVSKFLTPHYRVIVPDHVGFGESSHPAEADYYPKAQAERLHSLAQALGVKKAHIGGSSMGGHIAMTYAALFPQETSSLWLLDPGGVWSAPKSELVNTILETGKNPLMAKTTEDYANIFSFVMNKPPFIPKPMLNVMAKERINNFALEERIFKQLREDSVEERIKGLETPALIVWGDKDRALHPASAEIINKLMPKSKVIIMKDIGHLPMIENPGQSAEDYLKFRAS